MTVQTTKFKARVLILLNAATVIGGAITILLLINLLAKINHQFVIAHEDSVAATQTIENDLSCLGSFFSRPDRADLRITDLHSCKIINTKTGQTNTLDIDPAFNFNSSAEPTNNGTNAGGASKPDQTKTSQVAFPGAASTHTQKSSPAPQENPNHPLTLLGVKACIPATQVCLWSNL